MKCGVSGTDTPPARSSFLNKEMWEVVLPARAVARCGRAGEVVASRAVRCRRLADPLLRKVGATRGVSGTDTPCAHPAFLSKDRWDGSRYAASSLSA